MIPEEENKLKISSVKTLTEKGKLIITRDILNKIKYTCNKISAVEWSGVLFYTFEGDIVKPESFVCTIQDLFVMDKGTDAHTAFKYNEDIVDILETKPELEENCIMGFMHSHNNMAVFFSGEDMNELKDNSSNYFQYLSVVVNNKTDIIAKASFIAEVVKTSEVITKFKNSKGELKQTAPKEETTSEYIMYTADLVIELPEEEVMEEFFANRVNAVIAKANTKVVPTKSYTDYSDYYKGDYSKGNITPNKKDKNKFKGREWEVNKGGKQTTLYAEHQEVEVVNKTKEKDKDYVLFLCYILSDGETLSSKMQDLLLILTSLDYRGGWLDRKDLKGYVVEHLQSAYDFVLGYNYSAEEIKNFNSKVRDFMLENPFTNSYLTLRVDLMEEITAELLNPVK